MEILQTVTLLRNIFIKKTRNIKTALNPQIDQIKNMSDEIENINNNSTLNEHVYYSNGVEEKPAKKEGLKRI